MAKLGDVLGVSRLQHRVFKHPELLSCTSIKKQTENKLEGDGQGTTGITPPGEKPMPRADLQGQIQAL